MPATSLKVTVCSPDSTRLARVRPNCPSMPPPPPPPPAARRAIQMNRPTISSVGPKLNSSVSHSERSPGGLALTVTLFSSSSFESWSVFGEGRHLGLEVGRGLVVVLDLLLEVALHRLSLGGDLLDVAGAHLLEEGRRVRHPDALLGRREDGDEEPVEREQQQHDAKEPAHAEGQHRRLLGRLAATVRRRAHTPTRLAIRRGRRRRARVRDAPRPGALGGAGGAVGRRVRGHSRLDAREAAPAHPQTGPRCRGCRVCGPSSRGYPAVRQPTPAETATRPRSTRDRLVAVARAPQQLGAHEVV